MNKRQFTSKCLLAGGVAELLIALLHFLMPLQLSGDEEIAQLPAQYRSFVLLATLAIGLCVMVFGALCLYFSQKLLAGERTAWAFGISQGVLWAGRAILEMAFPVRIPLFFLPNPTLLVLPLSISLALLFLVPLLAFRKEEFLVTGRGIWF